MGGDNNSDVDAAVGCNSDADAAAVGCNSDVDAAVGCNSDVNAAAEDAFDMVMVIIVDDDGPNCDEKMEDGEKKVAVGVLVVATAAAELADASTAGGGDPPVLVLFRNGKQAYSPLSSLVL